VPRPLLYEIHTRAWLQAWSTQLGRPVRLGEVPDHEFARWRDLGFTHVWMMGMWKTSEASRQLYLRLPETAGFLNKTFPGWNPADVPGSAFAIAGYQVPEPMGGDAGLERLRAQLHAHGLRLILDYIPNHVGLDHPWVRTHPERFVGAPASSPVSGQEFFRADTLTGPRWLAHGKDPWFPAWVDTVQLDYRRADTREAMVAEFRSVAERCDGVRCDMAMLLLQDVFARTWQRCPQPDSAPKEFWPEAINAVRRPGFLFLAEAYWDMEERLQELGFDYVYDKRVTDCLMQQDAVELQRLLRRRSAEFLKRSMHFLENHDEPRAAGRLSPSEHRAAAWAILALPGMPLLHEGQLSGAKTHASVHLNIRVAEERDLEIARMYEAFLAAIRNTALRNGDGLVLSPLSPPGSKEVSERTLVVAWRGAEGNWALAIANPSSTAGQCAVDLPRLPPTAPSWAVLRDRLSPEKTPDAWCHGARVLLDVPAYATQLLEVGSE